MEWVRSFTVQLVIFKDPIHDSKDPQNDVIGGKSANINTPTPFEYLAKDLKGDTTMSRRNRGDSPLCPSSSIRAATTMYHPDKRAASSSSTGRRGSRSSGTRRTTTTTTIVILVCCWTGLQCGCGIVSAKRSHHNDPLSTTLFTYRPASPIDATTTTTTTTRALIGGSAQTRSTLRSESVNDQGTGQLPETTALMFDMDSENYNEDEALILAPRVTTLRQSPPPRHSRRRGGRQLQPPGLVVSGPSTTTVTGITATTKSSETWRDPSLGKRRRTSHRHVHCGYSSLSRNVSTTRAQTTVSAAAAAAAALVQLRGGGGTRPVASRLLLPLDSWYQHVASTVAALLASPLFRSLVVSALVTLIFEALIGHVLEFLKIVLQTSSSQGDDDDDDTDSLSYWRAIQDITAAKGVAGLWDGFVPWGLIQALSKGAVFGLAHAWSLSLLLPLARDRKLIPMALALTLAGGIGGGFQGYVLSPTLLLKTRVMTVRSLLAIRHSVGLLKTCTPPHAL
jgi:Mitochondrial carrier protein